MNNRDRIIKEGLSGENQSEEKNFQQWYRFIADHGFTWKGILSRYDGEGRLLRVLDSTRRFTPSADASQVEHYLYFVNCEDSSQVYENRWIIEKSQPALIHPVELKSRAMFSSQGSGVMSRAREQNHTNYAEIYLIEGKRRMSLLAIYEPEDSQETNCKCLLAKISLFREIKQEESSFPWSKEKPEITTREYPRLQVINSSMLRFGTFDEISVSNDAVDWLEENRLIFNFPDGVSLNVPKTLQPGDKTNLILSWRYSDDRIKRAIAQFSEDNRGPDLITQECNIL